MNLEPRNTHRISFLIWLIALLSLLLAGRGVGFAALRSLAQPTTTAGAEVAAGPPALLLLNADALVLAMNGESTALTVRVRDAIGRPVAGAAVQLQSDRGSVNPATVTTDAAGRATATFKSGNAPGQAVITAKAGNLAQQSAIQIVKPNTDATTHRLALTVGANKLEPGQTVQISAVLRDAAGQPVAGELVSLFGSLGEVTPASAMSDANGRVTASYRAGQAPGQAMVTALAGYASHSVAFQVGEVPAPDTSSKTFLPMIKQ